MSARSNKGNPAGRELTKAADAVADKTADKVLQVLHGTRTEIRSGPVPSAEELTKYEQVLPGSAERIFAMAELQAKHRHGLEKTVVDSGALRAKMGLVAGFIVAMTIGIGGIFVALKANPWAGATIVGVDLVGLVSVFVYGSQAQRKERETRAKLLGEAKEK